MQLTRKRSNIGRKPKHKRVLRTLGVPKKIGGTSIQTLTPSVAGALFEVDPFIDTHVVLPSNDKVEIHSSEAMQLAKGGSGVSDHPYKIEDDVHGVHLQWETGETARVEHHQDFVLVAWTSRLTATKALRLLHGIGRRGDLFLVDSLDESARLDPTAPLPDRLTSGSQLVRLMRLETDAETLIWEIPFTGQPASRRPAEGGYPAEERERPVFAVLAERLPEDRLRDHLRDTAAPFVQIAADKVVAKL